jgi:N-acetyl-anhydromuramyl-L-alanine amidase AmpD
MSIPFVQAKNCGPTRQASDVKLIVVHTMETPEKPHTAKNVALWFASVNAPQASAHYCLDADDTVQCVDELTVAWGAPGANRDGVHLEHAGYAAQSSPQWSDDYAMRMLARSAALAADIARRYDIPLDKLSPGDLADRTVKGFCGHVDITNGRNAGQGHQDPGPNFPWATYLDMVRQAMSPTDPPPPASEAPTDPEGIA